MKRMLLALLALSVPSSARSGEHRGSEAIRQEASRRQEALVRAGFNLIHGFGLTIGDGKEPIRLEFIVTDSGEHVLSFWMEATEGEASVRILGPDGRPRLEWAGRTGEAVVTLETAVGKYVLEINRAKAKQGEALFSVKGSVVVPCGRDVALVKEVPAVPSKGFQWPYLLFVPQNAKSPHLLVVPNNTGFTCEDVELLRASASCQVEGEAPLAERLGAAMLVPLFPRPAVASGEENLYLHALSRAALATTVPAWKRVDLQLLAMIRDARTRLKAQGIDGDGRVMLAGFSASGSFVNRFAMLHPDEVLAVAAGSPGGWPLAPVASVEGESLPYPVGIADVEALTGRTPDLPALRKVLWLFFLGDHDENDAVPYRDSFSESDQELIFRRFGTKPVARWKGAERLYAERGLRARFALYPGAAHAVTPGMHADVERFFKECLAQP